MMRAPHSQPGFVAAMLHRLAGITLALSLPLMFGDPAVAAALTAPTLLLTWLGTFAGAALVF
jgi:hypothetical protein